MTESFMEKPNGYETIKYAVKNIAFYSKPPYTEAAKAVEAGENLDNILKSLPVIDGEIFQRGYQKLLPAAKTPITVYMSSGSTGKPKIIPRTYDQNIDFSIGFVDNIVHQVMPDGMDIDITKLPPIPAISGNLMSYISKEAKSIEFSQGPGQTLADVLRTIEDIDRSGEKNIWIAGFPSALFREIYAMKEEDSNYLKSAISRLKLHMLTGGESLPFERAKLLYNLLPTNSSTDLIASSEGVAAYRVYEKDELEGDRPINKPFKFIGYNNKFMIMSESDGVKELLTPAEAIGKTGDVVITTKARPGAEYVPLINYNTKDVVAVSSTAEDDSFFGYYIGRSDGIKRFGAGKLIEPIIANTVAYLINNFKTGEGYSIITSEKGLDKLTFYIDKNRFEGDKDMLLKAIRSQLSAEQMEIAYSLEKGLCILDVELLDKKGVPFYTDRGKSKWLIDKR
ncbi:MAG: hypothetical protein QXK90_00070 [Candidatus Parvarchaeota archaeon]